MDIKEWLRALGLDQYWPSFRDNEIDIEVLPKLTAEDLKELGVLPLGHRRKLLWAIEELAKEPGTLAFEVPRDSKGGTTNPAERRPITVMFCDLVGSTSIAAKLDAEDWRELVNSYLEAAAKCVTDLGGHVLKKLGDGLMALFGYPRAQENDPERAARAGLAILQALEELNARNEGKHLPKLSARVGLESGFVVVDAAGEVFGDAPNVAARVQSAAQPGTVLATSNIHRQVSGLFVAEELGPHELKGVEGKPVLYRLVRASGASRRSGSRSLTTFVGREEELALIINRWERARGGDGQLVQIVGEPGLGKSRLVDEFRLRIAETPHTWVEWSASQLLQNTPLHPLVQWGRQRFGSADVPVEKRRSELELALTQSKINAEEIGPLLSPLLDIPVHASRIPDLSPEEQRQKQLTALVRWIIAGARVQPLVLAFEDLHWADPTTLDLMRALADQGAQVPLLIIATTRPEFRAPWTTRSHHFSVSLVPLNQAQIRTMVAAVAERHTLSKQLVDSVSDRTGGVPLFVEELTRLWLEGGPQIIPPTLQQSLVARLDRLGEAREIAQVCAVLGRQFSYGLLKTVAEKPEGELNLALEKLADADLLFVEGIAPASTYRFKHALIQDAAYESLLKSRRLALHRRTADALVLASEPQRELVAHHFTQADQTEVAIGWWKTAGEAALQRGAFQEAIAHLSKAIQMADKLDAELGNPAAREDDRLALNVPLGFALSLGRGLTDGEAKAAVERVTILASRNPESRSHFKSLHSQYIMAFSSGDLKSSRTIAADGYRLAERLDDPRLRTFANLAVALSSLYSGELLRACEIYSEVQRTYDRSWDDDVRQTMMLDYSVMAMAPYAVALFYSGEIDRGMNLLQSSEFEANASGHAVTEAYSRIYRLRIDAERRRVSEILKETEELLALTTAVGLPSFDLNGKFYAGWAQAQSGNRDEGLFECKSVIAERVRTGNLLAVPTFLSLLAEVEAASGDTDAALSHVDEALRLIDKLGEELAKSRAFMTRGIILDGLGDDFQSGAEIAYTAAVATARSQGARTLELQAALPFARFLCKTCRWTDACNLLSEALRGFASTPELPVIDEAQRLLAELEQREQRDGMK